MRFAYADPPYLGVAEKFYGHLHDRAADYDDPETHRALIERVVIQPGDGRGGKRREIQLHGALFEMLAFASSAAAKSSPSEKAQSRNAHSPRFAETGGCVTPLVAGTGFEPVTFRL